MIPKRIRDRLGLRGGETVELVEIDGEVRISRPKSGVDLVEAEGILTADRRAGLPGLGPEEVRELLERTRR